MKGTPAVNEQSLPPKRIVAWLVAAVAPLSFRAFGFRFLPDDFKSLESPLSLATWTLFLVLVSCAVCDYLWKRIPNWATYPGVLWALLINVAGSTVSREIVPSSLVRFGDDGPLFEKTRSPFMSRRSAEHFHETLGSIGIDNCLVGALVCFVLMFFLYRLSGGGAGDVKLATVIGAFLGLEQGLRSLALSYIAAGVFIVVWLTWTIGPWQILKTFGRKAGSLLFPMWVLAPTESQQNTLRRPIALAPFFALGTVCVMFKLLERWIPA